MFLLVGKHQALEFGGGAEVEQQADLKVGCSQVIEELGIVEEFQGFDGFKLDDYLVCDNQVGTKITDLFSAKPNRQRILPLQAESVLPQYSKHGFFID